MQFAGSFNFAFFFICGHLRNLRLNLFLQSICGDYTSKRIWAITQKDRALTSIHQIALCPQSISSFAMDETGELYAVGYEGNIYRIDLSTAEFHPQ